MSRFRRAFHNAASSYLALGAGTCFALASVPLALHYLSKERFALWALMASVSGYLSLLDLGMSASVARLLIDHKDRREENTYGSFLLTGWLVLLTQAIILFLAGYGVAPALASWLDIPPNLRPDFVSLMRWQAVTLGVTFAFRIFGQILYAHQRMDICNYSGVGAVSVNLVALTALFREGYGVFSLVWAGLVGAIVSALITGVACWKLQLIPIHGKWGQPCWVQFKALFGFGWDMFLMSAGFQLILISQTMIITRRLGLEPAALWAVGTKAYNLLLQLVWRTTDAPGPALAEMLARGERIALQDRYRTVVTFGTSFAVFCAIGFSVCNGSFITMWTAGRFAWPMCNDLLLGACVIVSALAHCHNWFIGITKEMRLMPYVFLIEGLVFAFAAYILAPQWHLQGIIVTSLICSCMFTGAYGVVRVARFFELPVYEVAWKWVRPSCGFFWRFALIAGLGAFLAGPLSPWARFFISASLCGTVGAYLLGRYGVPAVFQVELLSRLPRGIARPLTWIFLSGVTPPTPVAETPKL